MKASLLQILEMAVPTKEILSKEYYHGTPSLKDAQKIMKEGLRSFRKCSRICSLDPRSGKVYITPFLEVAIGYGFNEDGLSIKWLKDNLEESTVEGKASKNCYILVVSGNKLKNVEPDEDSVGFMVPKINWLKEKLFNLNKNKLWKLYKGTSSLRNNFENKEWLDGIVRWLNREDFETAAVVGKLLLPELTDEQKIELIEKGANIAHDSGLKPDSLWEILSKQIKKIDNKASNFFKVAQRIA